VKLVFVNSIWPESWGGGEKWTVAAAQWFREHGNETTIVARRNSKLISAAREHNLSTVETEFGGDYDPFAAMRAGNILRRVRPDLVIVNFNKEAWQFGWAARRLGIPVVARHGFPLFRKTLHHRFLQKFVLTKLVVNAASIREHYASLGFPVHEVEFIPNGTPLVTQCKGELRKRFGIADSELLVIAAGRLEPQKRMDRVIEIAETLRSNGLKARFLILGEGPLQENLQSQIQERKLETAVQLVGFIPDFAALAGDADLFLLTSDNEGTPNALLEAMAAAVPCVSFAIGSVPEILTGELQKYCIACGDLSEMSARARELLSNSELRSEVGQRMQARVRGEFSLDISMKRFEDLFHRILSR
jgi:glycosyltransferase involved in cell wall biosynthesis